MSPGGGGDLVLLAVDISPDLWPNASLMWTIISNLHQLGLENSLCEQDGGGWGGSAPL